MGALLENGLMRRLFGLALLSLSLFLLALFVVQLKQIRYVGADVFPQSTISVRGSAEEFVVPDTAEFTFSVIEEAETFALAQEAATLAINDVIAFLEEAGVDRDDIKTTNYSAYPRYEYRTELIQCFTVPCPPGDRKRELASYEVNQSVRVQTKEIDRIGELVAGVGSFGISQVSSVNFTVEDQDKLLEDVRDDAIADARAEAKRIADSLGVKLGRVVSFNEGSSPYARGGDFLYATAESSVASIALESPDIPAGENRLSVNVQVTYELR